MQDEIPKISGIEIINNVPHAVGADSVQKVFEFYGVKKSKKAVYKFISKASWKKRVKIDGKSMIAIPLPEIERWIKKNYPIIWDSKKEDEKEVILKNFKMMDNFERIIDEMEERLTKIEVKKIDAERNKIKKIEGDSQEYDDYEKEYSEEKEFISGIWSSEVEREKREKKEERMRREEKSKGGSATENEKEIENSESEKEGRTDADEILREQIDKIISTLLKNPPSDFKEETLQYVREKSIFILGFIDGILNLKSLKSERRK